MKRTARTLRAASAALAAFLGAALTPAPAAAHDFWIEPSSFRPDVGATIQVRLLVGPKFAGEPFPRVPKLVSRFVLASASGESEIGGRSGDEPAGMVRIVDPGLQVIGYRSFDYPVTIEAAKFETYLEEEGLEKIVKLRASRGDSGKPGREVFSRCAKALLDAGGKAGPGFDRVLGFTLELVPEKDPYALAAGGELPVRLLLDGKPLAGALVQGLLRGDPAAPVAARTGRDGRVTLRLPRRGFWLIKAVEMGPAPPGVEADWQSLWASLTFENGPRDPVGSAP